MSGYKNPEISFLVIRFEIYKDLICIMNGFPIVYQYDYIVIEAENLWMI